MSAPTEADLPTTDEATAMVARLLGNAIRPEVFLLADGSYEGRLTVEPAIALAALGVVS